jgi:hypothetical protein
MLKTRSGLPKHCTYQPDRDGKQRVRFRRRGVSRYLTGIPWSEDFMRQYAAALEADQQQRAQVGASLRSVPGSFSSLVASYYVSPEFHDLKASTQRVRRNILERFRAEHGHRAMKDLQTTHVRKIIGDKASTPEAAKSAESPACGSQLRSGRGHDREQSGTCGQTLQESGRGHAHLGGKGGCAIRGEASWLKQRSRLPSWRLSMSSAHVTSTEPKLFISPRKLSCVLILQREALSSSRYTCPRPK